MEEGKAPAEMGRETEREVCSGEESRRGFECTKAAGEEEDEELSGGRIRRRLGEGKAGGSAGLGGHTARDSLWSEVAGIFILW